MTNRETAERWVAGYRAAWESNDESAIRALFADDAEYYRSPHATPWAGAEAIVAGWLENADEAGSTTFEYAVLAVDGEVAVVRCVSGYPRESPPASYDNLFVLRLDDSGRAREFTDWWVERPGSSAGAS